MKKTYWFIILLFMIASCVDDKNPFGVYQARFKEKGTTHYLELFSDSTFCHVFEKGGIRYEHKGTFKLYARSIDFNEWKDFDERSIEYKKRYTGFGHRGLLLNKGQIFFDLDLYELNFKKE